MPKKPFRVFEAGSGKHPFDLIRKAVRSLKLGKNREFIGVDYDLFSHNLQAALEKEGLKKSPSNLRALSGCALREIEKIPKGSQNVVFAGFVVHQMILQKISYEAGVANAKRFLVSAREALAPNGRLVLIQHLKDRAFFEQIAKETGFRVYSREMTPEEMQKSQSLFVAQLRTHQGRQEVVRESIKKAIDPKKIEQEFNDFAKNRGVKEPADLYKPILFVLRKA